MSTSNTSDAAAAPATTPTVSIPPPPPNPSPPPPQQQLASPHPAPDGGAAAAALADALASCPPHAAADALRGARAAAARSSALCELVLEHALLHEAAAQQLHAATEGLAREADALLAAGRELAPLLARLRAAAADARELRALAEAGAAAGAGGGGGSVAAAASSSGGRRR